METITQTQTPPKRERKLYFRFLKKIMRPRYKKPRFVYLGEEIGTGGIIVSNHEGTDAPLSFEIYLDKPFRIWGTGEMNSGLIPLYKYQTRVYYHEKKHWNLHLARLFCLIASPLTHLFYSGLDLISTYKDQRFVKTLRESIAALSEGYNIVVYPEDSTKGYLPVLEGFHEGFLMLAELCYKRGMDLPIFVTYFRKKDLHYIIDAPVLYSELAKTGKTRAELAQMLCDRCNELGQMQFDEDKAEAAEQPAANS